MQLKFWEPVNIILLAVTVELTGNPKARPIRLYYMALVRPDLLVVHYNIIYAELVRVDHQK